MRFEDLNPAATPETVRWALRNCHLMRNRFTFVDLLFFLGWWGDDFVERLLERAPLRRGRTIDARQNVKVYGRGKEQTV